MRLSEGDICDPYIHAKLVVRLKHGMGLVDQTGVGLSGLINVTPEHSSALYGPYGYAQGWEFRVTLTRREQGEKEGGEEGRKYNKR